MNEHVVIKTVDLVYHKYKDLLTDPGTPQKVKDILKALAAIKDGKQIEIKEE
jgi:hypothetical protein